MKPAKRRGLATPVIRFITLTYHYRLWGAICKNIISDRFSTKTVISGRDSYLCMQRCYLWQRSLSLHAEKLSLAEIAISACRDVISGRDSYLCIQRCYLCQRSLSLHAEIALKRVEGLAFSALFLWEHSFCESSSPPLSAFRCKKRMLSQKERAEIAISIISACRDSYLWQR